MSFIDVGIRCISFTFVYVVSSLIHQQVQHFFLLTLEKWFEPPSDIIHLALEFPTIRRKHGTLVPCRQQLF